MEVKRKKNQITIDQIARILRIEYNSDSMHIFEDFHIERDLVLPTFLLPHPPFRAANRGDTCKLKTYR